MLRRPRRKALAFKISQALMPIIIPSTFPGDFEYGKTKPDLQPVAIVKSALE
jgi:hypothetical protein